MEICSKQHTIFTPNSKTATPPTTTPPGRTRGRGVRDGTEMNVKRRQEPDVGVSGCTFIDTEVVCGSVWADLGMCAEGFQSRESGKQKLGMTFSWSSASLETRDDFSNWQRQAAVSRFIFTYVFELFFQPQGLGGSVKVLGLTVLCIIFVLYEKGNITKVWWTEPSLVSKRGFQTWQKSDEGVMLNLRTIWGNCWVISGE